MIAFVLTRFPFFRDLIYQDRLGRKQQVTAIAFFGFFGIIGTYTGLSLNVDSLQFDRWAVSELATDEAIANSRVIGVVVGGLLGGYKVGIGAGLIAGLHRWTLGGFTAIACGLSAILSGFISGYFHKKIRKVKPLGAFFIAALAESLQMVIILFISQPFSEAWMLVKVIGLPMIFANGIGSALFLLIIKSVVNEEEKAGALQAQKTLRIANQTLAHLRNGLTAESAQEVCKIIHKEIQASAVAMTNMTDILAHVGLGSDHHQPNQPIQTQITLDAIKQGEIVVANQRAIHCRVAGCPLGAVVITPLRLRGKTVGTLKFYFRSEKEITDVVMELISGLGSMISSQLDLAEADKAYQLAKEAEIEALQAQISPHFLFNTMNTIVSLIRLDPKKARKLLISLSHYLRQNLNGTTNRVTTLEQELKHIRAYLEIEQARFIDKLTVSYDVDEDVLLRRIPPLTLQPLVENAIKHGIQQKEQDCVVKITIEGDEDKTVIKVEDNGQGMTEERAGQVLIAPVHSEFGTGMALYNVNRRLTMMFGEEAGLMIKSEVGRGTEISFSINEGAR